MFSYNESSIALLNKMMSVIGVRSINALIDRVNEVNVRQGLSKLTWMTINSHASGGRVFNRSSVDKLVRAMHRIDNPQRRQLVDLALRLAKAADIERAVVKDRLDVADYNLSAKQIVQVKELRAEGIREWRQTINRAYGVTRDDVVRYLKNRRYSSISCLVKIMNHLQINNLNRLTEWVNEALPAGMHLGGATLYTHLVDAERLLSEGGIRAVEVALMTDKSDRKLRTLARRFVKSCAVEKFAVLYKDRFTVVAHKIIKIRARDIVNWRDNNRGLAINNERLTAYLEKGESSITIIDNILANLNIVSLNRFTHIVNSNLGDDSHQINGGSLYGHFNDFRRLVTDSVVSAIVASMRRIASSRQPQLLKLAENLVEAVRVERYALSTKKPTALLKKIVARRRQAVDAKNLVPNFETYRLSSHEICGEMMELLATKSADHFVNLINAGLKKINANRTINQLPRLSPGIIYKHLKGDSILSESSLVKISEVVAIQKPAVRDKLQELAKQLTNACRVERLVTSGRLEDTVANRKLSALVNQQRTIGIDSYQHKGQPLHVKKD